MKCIHCGREIEHVAHCGLAVCDGCCAVCYRQDDPCADMSKLDYLDCRNRAIIADKKAGERSADISIKYGICHNSVNKLIRDGWHPAKQAGHPKA